MIRIQGSNHCKCICTFLTLSPLISMDMHAKTMESMKVTPQQMNNMTQGLPMENVTKQNAMIVAPANSQFTIDAAVTAKGGIMKPMYGQTLEPRVIPKVNMKNMTQMQVIRVVQLRPLVLPSVLYCSARQNNMPFIASKKAIANPPMMVIFLHSKYLSIGMEIKVPMSCEIVIKMGVYCPMQGWLKVNDSTWPACVTKEAIPVRTCMIANIHPIAYPLVVQVILLSSSSVFLLKMALSRSSTNWSTKASSQNKAKTSLAVSLRFLRMREWGDSGIYPTAMKSSCSKLGRRGMPSWTRQKVQTCQLGMLCPAGTVSRLKQLVKMTLPTRYATSTPRTTDICGYTPKREPSSFGVSSPIQVGISVMKSPTRTPWKNRKIKSVSTSPTWISPVTTRFSMFRMTNRVLLKSKGTCGKACR